jgi:xanthine dehydrogenase YagS FAD-binding subunit
MAKDMMPAFELFQPDSVDGAIDLLREAGPGGWALAGGNDSLDWFKDRVKRPERVVDLSGLDELKGIRELADGGLEIGALTTLTEIENHALVRERYGVLASAAGRVASPQIRNVGTLGGNLCQDARCWYYRYGVDCYRAGGNECYADSPQGQNREHCLWGADRCVAVSPSDTAPAMVVLDARMVVRSEDGEREVAAEDFFIGPDIDIERMTILEPGEILTAVRLPPDWAGARFYFEKVADRNTWDFALVSIASAMIVNGDTIERARMAAGGVQCVPRRLSVVENVVTGQAKSAATADLAGQSAIRNATPLNFNHFKIPLLRNLVTRAVRDS